MRSIWLGAFSIFCVLNGSPARSGDPGLSALDAGTSIEELDVGSIPRWPSVQAVEAGFRLIRDTEVVPFESSFRRIPWDYVEEGCSPRATLAADTLEKFGFKRPAKLFAFGPLFLEREDRQASWWYHVAPVVVAEEQVFVLDPSVNPDRPQKPAEWLAMMVEEKESATLSACSSFAYTPWSPCLDSDPEEEASAQDEIMQFLR